MTTRNLIAAILSTLLRPIAAAAADLKLEANFVASGAGVRTCMGIEKISNTGVAPSIAKLLGARMPDIEGQALDSILLPWSPNLSVSPSPNCPCPPR